MAPFLWVDYIYDSEGKQVSYRSFGECFEKNLLPNGFLQSREPNNIVGLDSSLESDFQKKLDFYKINGPFTYFVQLENEFDCNSLCEPNLFYINRELNHGVPHKECLQATSDAWGSSAAVKNYGEVGAALSITAGILLILASACSV